jgi:hypothetical protein
VLGVSRSQTTIADRYELAEPLGHGGMADVWAARDLRLRRDVAVKFLSPDVATRADGKTRFEAEARSAASLNHPNIVTVYDSGEHDGSPFLVMERLPGRTLADEIADAPLEPERALIVARDVLAALEAAHGAGIVHRDIKPANVLLCPDGTAKVADFGIAKASSEVDVTTGRMILGTPAYLAPERLAGRPATPASDLYSVGVLLYEALSGRAPFEGPSPVAVAKAVQSELPPPLAELRPELPGHLVAAVARAMDKDPDRRFASATEMAHGLSSPVPTQNQPQNHPQKTALEAPPPPRPAWPSLDRRPMYAGLALLTVVLIAWVVIAAGDSGESGTTAAATTTILPKPLPTGSAPIPAGRYTTTALVPGIDFSLESGWSMPEGEAGDVVTLRRGEPGRGDLELSFLTVKRVFRADGRYSTARDYIAADSVEPAPRPLTDWLARHPRLRAARSGSATVAGAAAARLDVEVGDGYASDACAARCVMLFQLDAERPKYRVVKLEQDRRMRLYVVDLGDRTVVISIVAPTDDFERSIAPAESVVKSLSLKA